MALTLPSIWSSLDRLDDVELYDTAEEARAFDTAVRAEAEHKLRRLHDAGVEGGNETSRADRFVQSSRRANTSVGKSARREPEASGTEAGHGKAVGMTEVRSPSPLLRPILPSSATQDVPSGIASIAPLPIDNAFDRSVFPSFHPSAIQHCSTPFDVNLHVVVPTTASVSSFQVTFPGTAQPAAGGPGPQTAATRARRRFSKVVSAPVLPRAAADTQHAPRSPAKVARRTQNKATDGHLGPPSVSAVPSPVRRRIMSDLLPSYPRATADQTDITLASTIDEAPSRTHVITTPLASKVKPSTLASSRDGQTDLSVQVPAGDITDTPLVASPIDTPDADGSDAQMRAAQAAAAITPLGSAKLRSGKSYLSLTKHFEVFTKALNKPEKPRGRSALGKGQSGTVAGEMKRKVSDKTEGGNDVGQDKVAAGKSRALERSDTVVAVLGEGEGILANCRFCIPPDHAGLSKHKHRWNIITKLGGQVVLTPDTATTHIIYEGRAPAALARDLGLSSIDELPYDCVCVKWEWIANCKLQSCKLDPGPYLSFGRKPSGGAVGLAGPLRTSSRLMDITDQIKGRAAGSTTSATSIRRRRDATPSDSETESSKPQIGKRVRSSPIQLMRHQPRPRTASSPAKMGAVSFQGVAPADTVATPPQLPLTSVDRKGKGRAVAVPSVATDHGPASKPQWNDGGTQDGLDAMINGVQSGQVDSRLEEDEDSPDRDPDPQDQAIDAGNPCPMADRFKCGQAHDGSPLSPEEHPNEWLAKKFEEMHSMYSGAKFKNEWQVRGYIQAAAAMRRTKKPITSGADAMANVKGIGTSMKDRIDEWISGRPGRQYYDMDEQMHAVSWFAKIYGVGKHQANDLYTRGARSIADLSAPGNPFGLSAGQLTGVALYDDLNTRIPRAECKEIFDLVKAEAVRADRKVWIEIMGSYRRGSENSGDVDFLITRDTEDGRTHAGVLRKLVKGLHAAGIITHELSLPHNWDELEAKWMGICRLPGGLHRRIDILCIPFEQWGAALLYFTGNDIFNRSMRLYARKLGYSLNQRGLSKGVIRGKDGLKFTEGEIVASRTEEEIFARLGLRWR